MSQIGWGELFAVAAAMLTVIGGLVRSLWMIVGKKLEAIEDDVRTLHSRINEFRENYVRREDFDKHTELIRADIQRVSQAVDRVCDALVGLRRNEK